MGTYTTASFLVLPKRPSAHDLCSVMNSANQTNRPRIQRSQNQVLLLPGTVPVQSDRLQSRSEKEQSPKPLDSPSTFLTAIISKLMTIMRACFPLRKIRSVKRQGRPYGGGRQERRVFNIYMLRSLHILFY